MKSNKAPAANHAWLIVTDGMDVTLFRDGVARHHGFKALRVASSMTERGIEVVSENRNETKRLADEAKKTSLLRLDAIRPTNH